jgi:hypothetical protein
LGDLKKVRKIDLNKGRPSLWHLATPADRCGGSLLLNLWLANCYLARDSSRFLALAPILRWRANFAMRM